MVRFEMYFRRFLIAACFIVYALVLASCTLMWEGIAEDGQSHTSTMPAVQVCVMSACDGQWADRAQRAGDDAEETGDVDADQTATAVPTVKLDVMPDGTRALKENVLDPITGAVRELEMQVGPRQSDKP